MKKHIITVLATLTFSLTNGQNKPKPDFGLKTGFNCAYVTNIPNGFMQVRYHIGAFVKFPLTHKSSLQPEVQYSGQGVNIHTRHLDLNYLAVPVLLKYYLGKDFHLEFGPQYGHLISAKEIPSEGMKTNAASRFNSSDFSLDFGITYTFDFEYILGLRYNLGLTQIQKDLATDDAASKNSVLQISLGYKF